MANFQPKGVSRKPMREVKDSRKPLYIIFVLDTSSSMEEAISVKKEGGKCDVRKIDELNKGLETALGSLNKFATENVAYKIYYQVIELNTYGKALFPDFVQLSESDFTEVKFSAKGVTCLECSISTLKNFLSPTSLPGCNRAVNVILMSDGYPTDTDGYVVGADKYGKVIDDFKNFLEENGLRRNVDLYSIGVGNCCEEMLKTFADENRFFKVDELESLADKLDFVTRKSLVRHSSGLNQQPMTQNREIDRETAINDCTYVIDSEGCLKQQCLLCIGSCPVYAIAYNGEGVFISQEKCVGCGKCAPKCPVKAISVKGNNGDGTIS